MKFYLKSQIAEISLETTDKTEKFVVATAAIIIAACVAIIWLITQPGADEPRR